MRTHMLHASGNESRELSRESHRLSSILPIEAAAEQTERASRIAAQRPMERMGAVVCAEAIPMRSNVVGTGVAASRLRESDSAVGGARDLARGGRPPTCGARRGESVSQIPSVHQPPHSPRGKVGPPDGVEPSSTCHHHGVTGCSAVELWGQMGRPEGLEPSFPGSHPGVLTFGLWLPC